MSADSDEGQAKKVPPATIVEPEKRDVRRIAGEADDQVQVIGITRFGSIRLRRDRRRSGMRVVEADDVQPAPACLSPPVDVTLRVNHEAGPFLVGDVSCPNHLGNLGVVPKQQSTALCRNGFPRVGDDLSQD